MTEEEINQFFLDNRTKSADTVNSIYNDPRYASTIFNSSVPLPQLEKNIKQSKGATLEPYDPSWTDTARYDLAEGVKNLGVPNYPAQNFAKGMYGNRNAERMIDQFGFLDAAQMFVPSLIPPMMMLYGNEAYRGFDKAINKEEQDWTDYISPVMDSVGLGVQGYFVGKSLKEPVKNFFQSVKNKFTKTPKSSFKTTDADFGALQNLIEANETKKLSGPTIYNQNKVLANTANKQPSMAVTDPKVVDDLGFYSEAERQAKMMQQNKGSGAQFQGMLLNKGVKLDEIKALGLDELFKNEKVTKKEIVDTIDLNKFQLIEKKRIGTDSTIGYEMESFTDIRGTDGSSFATIDEIKNAQDTGKYERPVIRYEDGMFNGYETVYEGEQLTHVPTQHKIVRVESIDSSDIDEVFFTFKPNAKTDDWRNSNEAKQYVDEINETGGDFGAQDKKAETGNLTQNDFDTIIREYAPYSFDEATVRLQSAAEDGGNVPFAKFESNTQQGGENYKEFVLSLPPFDKTKGYQDKVDINFPRHFPEYNPLFHIRTKDRTTSDGKKVLYVEELQSDWGQQGRNKGFKLEGEDLEKAKAKLSVAEDDLMKLKDFEVKLTPSEAEELFALKNPTKSEIENPLRPSLDPMYNSYATIEEIAKLRQYRNYKVLHKLGDLSDEFFNQLDLSQMGRTQDEVKSEIIKMFGSGRLDMMSPLNRRNAPNEVASIVDNEKVNKAQEIIKKYYKATTQAKGEDAPIPDAPFVKDTEKWTGLAIKRLLQMAEKGEYDHIAFSPGSVQFDRWGDEGLKKYYDEIIPSVAQDVTRKMSDKSSNMKTTTRDLEVQIPSERSIGISQRGDGKYFVNIQGSDKPIDNKFFNTREEAYDFADMVDEQRTNQKTFAINITPKVRDTARSGQAMFSLAAGLTAGASALSNQDVGALGSLPNDGT
jgi:hypothetical protein